MALYTGAPRNAAEQAARAKGYLGGFGGDGYNGYNAGTHDAYGNPVGQAASTPTTNNGVLPVGMVEPFHDNQNEALGKLAGPGNTAYRTGFLDTFQKAMAGAPNPGQFYGQAGTMLSSGGQPISIDELIGATSGLMNPARQQVQDRTMAGLEQLSARNKAQILSRTPGSRSFGSSAQGVQMGLADEGFANAGADALADLNYKTYNDALGAAGTLLTGNRSRSLAGASTAGNLGNSAMQALMGVGDMAQQGEGIRRQGVQDQLYAGDRQQSQGQKYLDVLGDQISGANNYDRTNLDWLSQLLGKFPGSTQETTYKPNTMSQIGGAGLTASQLPWDKWFGGGGGGGWDGGVTQGADGFFNIAGLG